MTTPGQDSSQPVPADGYAVPPHSSYQGGGGHKEPEWGPLVPPPQGGLSALWHRLTETLQRSGRTVAQILLLTVGLPQIAGGIWVELFTTRLPGGTEPPTWSDGQLATAMGGWAVFMLLWTLVTVWLSAWGWAASIVAITEQAVGAELTVGRALRLGARRMWSMTGWYLLYGLMVLLGLGCLVVPGLYLMVAGGLFSLVVIYEGQGGIGRSFALVHSAFGAALGRIGLVWLFLFSAYCVLGTCLSGLGFSTSTSASFRVVGDVIGSLVGVLLLPVVVIGLLLTYTQLRARSEPLTTDQLVSAARQVTGVDSAGASSAGG